MNRQPFDFETAAANAAARGLGDDFFAGGHLARLLEWHRQTTDQERISVEVTLLNGESFYAAQVMAVEKTGFLMFVIEGDPDKGDPHDVVFVPSATVAKCRRRSSAIRRVTSASPQSPLPT